MPCDYARELWRYVKALLVHRWNAEVFARGCLVLTLFQWSLYDVGMMAA
jgi:hypothetical protein